MTSPLVSPEWRSPDSAGASGVGPGGRGRGGWRWGSLAAGVIAVVVVGYGIWAAVVLFGMGWSERRLAPVRLGMGPAEVTRVAGAPVSRWPVGEGGECWSYTRWWSADAEVYFDRAGRVRAVVTD